MGTCVCVCVWSSGRRAEVNRYVCVCVCEGAYVCVCVSGEQGGEKAGAGGHEGK